MSQSSSADGAAIVVGAASGIGQATAIQLAQVGYRLLLVGRTQSKLQATADRIREQSGASAVALTLDIAQAGSGQTIVRHAMDHLGHIGLLANIAGYASMQPIPSWTIDQWRRTMDTNLTYVMELTAAAWPQFVRQKSGLIVNVSSLASVDPFPGFCMYAPAKAALNMFTRITAQEGQAIGLKALAIAPGAVETPMLRSLFDTNILPTQRTLSPDQVARIIVDCATGKRAFESGETILVPSP